MSIYKRKGSKAKPKARKKATARKRRTSKTRVRGRR